MRRGALGAIRWLLAASAVGCSSVSTRGPAEPAAAPVVSSTPAPSPSPDAGLTPDEPFRARAPEPLTAPAAFEAPVPVSRRLSNGLDVLLLENHRLPLVCVDLVVKTGTDGNPLDKPGLAELMAAALDQGTAHRSATEIADALDEQASRLTVLARADSTVLHLESLREGLSPSLALLADVALSPAFRADDVERVRKAALADAAQRQSVPALFATDQAARLLYGDAHPWGRPLGGTAASLPRVSAKDLAAWHRTHFVPANAFVVVAGDVQPDEMVKRLEELFGRWKRGAVPRTAALPAESRAERGLWLAARPGSQAYVLVTQRVLKADDPDAIPLTAANYVLGGLFTSRLNMNLREQRGFTLGVRSGVSFNHRTGVFRASSSFSADHAVEAIGEMEKELTRFAQGDVTEAEAAAAKTAFAQSLPSLLETNEAMASAVDDLVLQGLPLDYYRTLPQRVAALTQADLARVARKWVRPEQWPIIVVGPVAGIKTALVSLNLGPVQDVPP